MSYRSMENLIRGIMAESHAPALKIPEPERVKDALEVLAKNGVKSAARQDENTITVNAAEINIAADVLDRAVQNGLIQAKPQMVSAEAIPVPDHRPEPVTHTHEPHPPAGGNAFGEETVEEGRTENDTEQNNGEVKADGTVELHPRSLNNRAQNQIKKIDEEEEQIDEKQGHRTYLNIGKTSTNRPGSSIEIKKGHRQKITPVVPKVSQLAKEEVEQIDELSYGKLKAYTTAGKAALTAAASGNKIDKKIAQRKAYLDKAAAKKVKKISNAAFGEEAVNEAAPIAPEMLAKIMKDRRAIGDRRSTDRGTADRRKPTCEAVKTVLRVINEGAQRPKLVAVHHSECGKHCAKVYGKNEYGEHVVKFHYNGTHHEPADYHTDHLEDAHGTARHEMKRATKLNGALKEAAESTVPFALSEELVVEFNSKVSKVGTYNDRHGNTLTMHRSSSDPKHHFLVHNGQVKDYHHGSAEDFHKKITSGPHGLTGALHEEVLNEISQETKTSYAIKAASSKREHIAKGTAALARGNATKGEPETKKAHLKKGGNHLLKAHNRHVGIKRALGEEVLEEGKKDEAEKAKKHLFKLPIANEIGHSIHAATKHFTYTHDAVDHVYNNHRKELSFEDFDKIKPHLQAHFKQHGLKD